jgi:hypothetical protein
VRLYWTCIIANFQLTVECRLPVLSSAVAQGATATKTDAAADGFDRPLAFAYDLENLGFMMVQG